MNDPQPLVPATVALPEITVKSVLLSIILAAVLAAANAYLGLFAGMTVSASIPAAVASMAILRFFRKSNILENNIVQTAASSGEALAAGVIFTIPALLLVGYWSEFDYRQTVLIAAVGGLLGVLFTIPLRRALIVTAHLRFPEGVATAEVLKVGAAERNATESRKATRDFQSLLSAALLGSLVKFCESGLRLWAESVEGAAQTGRTVFYAGLNLSPALLAVGFIIGLQTAAVVFLGGVIGWVILMPAYGLVHGLPPDRTGLAAAMSIWSGQIRYVGIGAMLTGGLWTLMKLREPVWNSLITLRARYRASQVPENTPGPLRTEQDAPFLWIVVPFALSLLPMAWIYSTVVGNFLHRFLDDDRDGACRLSFLLGRRLYGRDGRKFEQPRLRRDDCHYYGRRSAARVLHGSRTSGRTGGRLGDRSSRLLRRRDGRRQSPGSQDRPSGRGDAMEATSHASRRGIDRRPGARAGSVSPPSQVWDRRADEQPSTSAQCATGNPDG